MIKYIPEWAESEAVLLAFPHKETDWNYILEEAIHQFLGIAKGISDENIPLIILCDDFQSIFPLFKDCKQDKIYLLECDFNDTWTRDYGPISVFSDNQLKANDFGFNGWGLKFAADKDNLVNLQLLQKGVIKKESYKNNRDFILEGGSIETDGKGNLLTTTRCLCSQNRNGGLSKDEVKKVLIKKLGVENILFLDYGSLPGDDTDSHIDNLARMTPDNKILYSWTDNEFFPSYYDLKKMEEQLKTTQIDKFKDFELIRLPLPDPCYDEDGNMLPASYCNYLIINNCIFVPTYKQKEKDENALLIISKVFPKHKIIGIDCSTLIKQHGSLHCSTMQLPKGLIDFEKILCNERRS